jgi:hypothetical protein
MLNFSPLFIGIQYNKFVFYPLQRQAIIYILASLRTHGGGWGWWLTSVIPAK